MRGDPPAPSPFDLGHEAGVAARQAVEGAGRAGCQSTYLGDHTVLCRVLGRYLVYVDTRDRAHGPHLIMDGFWEAWITAALQRLIEPGMICVDVGANLGYYTTLFADLAGPTGRVLAFEPNPPIRELLESTLRVNGFAERTTVHAEAVTDRDGDELSLAVPDGVPMNASIARRFEEGRQTVVTTDSITLDTACRDLERVDLIKIDAEGAEIQVWAGMQQVLDQNPDAIVVLEFNATRGVQQYGGLLERIRERFPVLRHIDHDATIVEIDPGDLLVDRGTSDFMLCLARHAD